LTATLFPYTTLFRSVVERDAQWAARRGLLEREVHRCLEVCATYADISCARGPEQALEEIAESSIAELKPHAIGARAPESLEPRRSEEHTSELQSRGH